MPAKKRERAGRGDGNIKQLEDGRWKGRLSYINGAGKRCRPTFYADTRREVVDQIRDHQQKLSTGQVSGERNLTVKDYLERWLKSREASADAQTHASYEGHIRLHLVPHLGRVRLTKISPIHIEGLYADMAKAGATASTQKRVGVTLGTALQHAVHPLRLIASNPVSSVPKPKATKAEIVCLTREQARTFLDGAKEDRLFALYATWLGSGARAGELFALLWSDINFKAKTLSITKSLQEVKGVLKVKETKTKKSRRLLCMPEFAITALADHRRKMLAEGNCASGIPVFCGKTGVYYRRPMFHEYCFRPLMVKINEEITTEAEKQGIAPALLPRIRPYDLRHTCASLLIQAGEPIKVVSERLGHSNVTITLNTYVHVMPGMQEKCAETVQSLFG